MTLLDGKGNYFLFLKCIYLKQKTFVKLCTKLYYNFWVMGYFILHRMFNVQISLFKIVSRYNIYNENFLFWKTVLKIEYKLI